VRTIWKVVAVIVAIIVLMTVLFVFLGVVGFKAYEFTEVRTEVLDEVAVAR
jgi:hypothetical protein